MAAVEATAFSDDEHTTSLAVTRHEDGERLTGEVRAVLDGNFAQYLLCPAREGSDLVVYGVAADDAKITSLPTLDLTRGLATVRLDDAPATQLSRPDAATAIRKTLDFGAIGIALESIGSAEQCLALTVEYAKIRQQFGQVIGSFQAIKHACADLARLIEPAKAAAYAALEAVATHDPDAPRLASVAALSAAEAATEAAGGAIQMHGAIGFTWEHELHMHLKRSITSRALFGSRPQHRRRLGQALLAQSTQTAPTPGQVIGTPPAVTGESAIEELRAEVRAWLAEHAADGPPLELAHETMSYEPANELEKWVSLLREARWLCLSWPAEYGGRGLDALECIAVNEEFARAGVQRTRLGMGEALVAPAILSHGTEEQKAHFLPRILSGEDVYCQGFSEPGSGSDLAGLRTRGVIDGDELVIDGEKIWQSSANRSNMIFTLCRTDPESPRHKGISYVLVPIADNNVRVEQIRMLTGDYGFNQVRYEGARAPLANVIGGLNAGWRVAMTTLGAERAGEATTQYMGYERELLELVHALGISPNAIDDLPPRLVDAYLEVQLMRSGGRRIADSMMAGQTADGLLAVDKVNWSEYHVWFGEMAVEEIGLDGIVRPEGAGYQLNTFQRVLLESRGRRIARGTNQIQRNIIAERLLGLPK